MSLGTAAGRSSTFAYDGTNPKLTSVKTRGVANTVESDAAGNEKSYIATRTHSPRNLDRGDRRRGLTACKMRNVYGNGLVLAGSSAKLPCDVVVASN